MLLGYNTNGLAHHRLLDALDLLAAEGYRSVALTLDAGALDPYDDPEHLARQVRDVRQRLADHGLRCVVETGARYLLNPHRKHDPTLLDPDPARRVLRIDFLRRAIDLAATLQADAVSFWSGALPDPIAPESALDRLAAAMQPVLEHARRCGVPVGFEPEPGMFIDTFARFAQLDERLADPWLQLTIDVGHVHCIEPGIAAETIAPWVARAVNIHIEDMVRGVHDHLMFGEGTMDFPPILASLRQHGYRGGLHVELSRHSVMGADAVRQAARFLRPLLDGSSPPA